MKGWRLATPPPLGVAGQPPQIRLGWPNAATTNPWSGSPPTPFFYGVAGEPPHGLAAPDLRSRVARRPPHRLREWPNHPQPPTSAKKIKSGRNSLAPGLWDGRAATLDGQGWRAATPDLGRLRWPATLGSTGLANPHGVAGHLFF
jgi:hypothetical protein